MRDLSDRISTRVYRTPKLWLKPAGHCNRRYAYCLQREGEENLFHRLIVKWRNELKTENKLITILDDNVDEISLRTHNYIFRFSILRYFSHKPSSYRHGIDIKLLIITVRFGFARMSSRASHMDLYRPSEILLLVSVRSLEKLLAFPCIFSSKQQRSYRSNFFEIFQMAIRDCIENFHDYQTQLTQAHHLMEWHWNFGGCGITFCIKEKRVAFAERSSCGCVCLKLWACVIYWGKTSIFLSFP